MDFFLICSEVSKSDFLLMSFSSYLDCQVDLNKQLLHLNLLRRAALALVDIFSSWATVSKDLQKCLAHTSGEEPQDKPLLCHLQPSFLCVLFYFVFCFCFVLVVLFCFPVVLLCSPHSCKITDCRSLQVQAQELWPSLRSSNNCLGEFLAPLSSGCDTTPASWGEKEWESSQKDKWSEASVYWMSPLCDRARAFLDTHTHTQSTIQ